MLYLHYSNHTLCQAKKSGGPAAGASAPPAAPAVKKLPPGAAPSKAAKGGAVPAPGGLDTFKYKHTPEDAEALAAELIPSNLATDLADANWKTRLAALEEMTVWVEGIAGEVDAEVLIRALAKKGWSEKNFQVSFLPDFTQYSTYHLMQLGVKQNIWHFQHSG